MTKINKGHCEEEITKGNNNTNSKLKLILVNTTTLKKGYQTSCLMVEHLIENTVMTMKFVND